MADAKEPERIIPKNAPSAEVVSEGDGTKAAKGGPQAGKGEAGTTQVTAKVNLIHPTTGKIVGVGEKAHVPHDHASLWAANGLAELHES